MYQSPPVTLTVPLTVPLTLASEIEVEACRQGKSISDMLSSMLIEAYESRQVQEFDAAVTEMVENMPTLTADASSEPR